MRSSSPTTEIVRCRPALGTYVRIAVAGLPQHLATRTIDSAFATVERIEALMSFYRVDSQLHELHRNGLRRWTPISRELSEVLALSKKLYSASAKVFDPSIGGKMMHAGLLPLIDDLPEPDLKADFSQLSLSPGFARLRRPILLDLGGIAKGYAVDRALATIRKSAAVRASVNAGGDLARFGGEEIIALQHPIAGRGPVAAIKLSTGAMATSSDHYARLTLRTRNDNQPSHPSAAITVLARRCALADGLTKIAWLHHDAATVLRRFGARALRIEVNGEVVVLCG